MDRDERNRVLEERLRNLTARDDDVLKKVEKVIETQETQRVQFEKIWNVLQTLLQRTSDGDVPRKLESLSESVTVIKKNVTEGNEEIGLIKKQQLLLLKGTQAHEEVLRNFAQKVGEQLLEVNEKLKTSKNIIGSLMDSHEQLKEKVDVVKDIAETTLGYSESFVDDFENTERKMEKIQMKLDNMNGNCLHFKDKIMKIEAVTEETKETVASIKSYFGITAEPIFSCCNRECRSMLPYNLPLREDRVSVKCPNCGDINVVGRLEEGQKWMYVTDCDKCHFNQFPLDRDENRKYDEKCKICGKEGELRDEFKNVAFQNNFKYVLRKMNNEIRRIETSVALLSGPTLTCHYCECILPITLPIREDGVSVKCPKCVIKYSIVGKLNENHKWMMGYRCDYHFQQVPCKIQHDTIGECQVCGKEGKLIDANSLVAANDTS